MILQFFPAASVAPQGLKVVPRPKSPLVTILPMFKTEVPVLVKVTTWPAAVVPTLRAGKVSEVGLTVTVGPPPVWVTVKLNVVVCVMLPEVPVTVTVEVPRAAVLLAVNVNVLVVLVGFGLNPADTPLGRPEALNVTVLLKPFSGVTVMALVAVPLCATLTEAGLAPNVKPGDPPAQPGKANDEMLVCQLNVPLVCSY